jgi:L-tartrate/succinate antiporter
MIFAANSINATTVALAVVAMMLAKRLGGHAEIPSGVEHVRVVRDAGDAGGLNRVGFAKWFAEAVAGHLTVVSPEAAIVILVGPFFFSHYMFAVVTTHTTAMLPVMLALGDPSGADAPTPLLWQGGGRAIFARGWL